MPSYYYQALDEEGGKKKGYLDSDSQARAYSQLQEQGLTPVRLTRVRSDMHPGRSWFVFTLPWGKRIRIEEAFYYLGLMLKSGGSLVQSLDFLGRMAKGKNSRVWMGIRDSVESGVSFSRSLENYPAIFPGVYIGMIQVAEKTGHLAEILERIAGYEDQRREVQGRLLTALAYPMVVLLIATGAVYFLLTRVLPRVAGIFEASGQDLPLHTRVLMGAGQWMESYGVLLVMLAVLVAAGGWSLYKKVHTIRYRVDAGLWRLPLFRDLILARFSGLLSFQLRAGISLVQAIQGSVRGIGSEFFRERMEMAAAQIATGRSLEQVLAGQRIFPEMYLTALGAGAKTGQLAGFLERLSNILEREVDNTLRRMVGLVEPALILLLGLVVGFFVLAVMGPIFDITAQI